MKLADNEYCQSSVKLSEYSLTTYPTNLPDCNSQHGI